MSWVVDPRYTKKYRTPHPTWGLYRGGSKFRPFRTHHAYSGAAAYGHDKLDEVVGMDGELVGPTRHVQKLETIELQESPEKGTDAQENQLFVR